MGSEEQVQDDIRTYAQKRAGWWMEKYSRVPCAFIDDGLLCAFRRVDIEALMDRTYPHIRRGGMKIWYFNETKDREIADMDLAVVPGEVQQIICNPQVYWQHYQERTSDD